MFLGLLVFLSRLDLAEHFQSRFKCAGDIPLSFLDLYQVTEIPRELLSEIKVIGFVLRVDIFVVKDHIEHPLIDDCWMTSDLTVLVGSVLELKLLLVPACHVLLHENIADHDFFTVTISCLDGDLTAARHKIHARKKTPIQVKE